MAGFKTKVATPRITRLYTHKQVIMKEDNVYNNNFNKTARVIRIVNNVCKENSETSENTNEDLNK